MKGLFLLLLGLLGMCAYAQNNIFGHLAFTTGYHYNGRNSFYGGLSFSESLKKSDKDKRLLVSAGSYLTRYEQKWQFVPEIGIWYPPFRDNYLGMFGAVATQKHIEPQFVFSSLNVFTLHLGYAFPFEEKVFKGFTLGIRFHIGLTKNSDFYIPLKVGF